MLPSGGGNSSSKPCEWLLKSAIKNKKVGRGGKVNFRQQNHNAEPANDSENSNTGPLCIKKPRLSKLSLGSKQASNGGTGAPRTVNSGPGGKSKSEKRTLRPLTLLTSEDEGATGFIPKNIDMLQHLKR